ncbi:hypothetical protein ACIQPQ_35195 [Streptomyces sp. NPDC091281]|uniref:hypothetical protein n=1 Tax=Streptomyces sp. NPDC091281 TaxID=3365985 RepID=UPI00382D82A5
MSAHDRHSRLDEPEEHDNHPATALEDVLREIEEAERLTDDAEHGRGPRHRGETGDAHSPAPAARDDAADG